MAVVATQQTISGLLASKAERQLRLNTAIQFHKTKLCKFVNRGAVCVRDNCTYAHSEDELKEMPNLWKTKMCPRLIKQLPCDDANCSFAHSQNELRPLQENRFMKTKLCHHFSNGRCVNGDKCRFAHGKCDQRDLECGSPPKSNLTSKLGKVNDSGTCTPFEGTGEGGGCEKGTTLVESGGKLSKLPRGSSTEGIPKKRGTASFSGGPSSLPCNTGRLSLGASAVPSSSVCLPITRVRGEETQLPSAATKTPLPNGTRSATPRTSTTSPGTPEATPVSALPTPLLAAAVQHHFSGDNRDSSYPIFGGSGTLVLPLMSTRQTGSSWDLTGLVPSHSHHSYPSQQTLDLKLSFGKEEKGACEDMQMSPQKHDGSLSADDCSGGGSTCASRGLSLTSSLNDADCMTCYSSPSVSGLFPFHSQCYFGPEDCRGPINTTLTLSQPTTCHSPFMGAPLTTLGDGGDGQMMSLSCLSAPPPFGTATVCRNLEGPTSGQGRVEGVHSSPYALEISLPRSDDTHPTPHFMMTTDHTRNDMCSTSTMCLFPNCDEASVTSHDMVPPSPLDKITFLRFTASTCNTLADWLQNAAPISYEE